MSYESANQAPVRNEGKHISIPYAPAMASAKPLTTDLLSIDVRLLYRDGICEDGARRTLFWTAGDVIAGSVTVIGLSSLILITYVERSTGGPGIEKAEPVALSWTACHFGGKRPWFICPSPRCGRRVAILYGGRVFTCRHCNELTYPCQRESESDRLLRKAEKIRERLNSIPGVVNPLSNKPVYMHWKTFLRLVTLYDKHARKSFALFNEELTQSR